MKILEAAMRDTQAHNKTYRPSWFKQGNGILDRKVSGKKLIPKT